MRAPSQCSAMPCAAVSCRSALQHVQRLHRAAAAVVGLLDAHRAASRPCPSRPGGRTPRPRRRPSARPRPCGSGCRRAAPRRRARRSRRARRRRRRSSSAGGTTRRRQIWLPIVPLGTKTAASWPNRPATCSSRRVDRRVLAVDVVADLGGGHRRAHAVGRAGERVAAQVDGGHAAQRRQPAAYAVGVAERDRVTGSGATALTADRAVAAVRVHLDRVHDAVLRTGCTPADAVEVVRADRARAGRAQRRRARRPPTRPSAGGSPTPRRPPGARRSAGAGRRRRCPSDDRPAGAAAALDAPARATQRLAVLLRDAYDLPLPAVAAAPRRATPPPPSRLARRGPRGAARPRDAPARRLDACSACPPPRASDVLPAGRGPARRPAAAAGPSARPAAAAVAGRALRRRRPSGAAAEAGGRAAAVTAARRRCRWCSPCSPATGVGLLLARQDGPQPLAVGGGAAVRRRARSRRSPRSTAVPSPPTVPQVRPRTQVVVVPPSPLPTADPVARRPRPTPDADGGAGRSRVVPRRGPNGTELDRHRHRLRARRPGARSTTSTPPACPTGSSAVAVADESGSLTATAGRRRTRPAPPGRTPCVARPSATPAPPSPARVFTAQRAWRRGAAQPRRCCSISATRKLSSSAWLVLSRGSQAVS